MGYRELIDALRREGEEKGAALRRETDAEAARLEESAAGRAGRLREEFERRLAGAVADQRREFLANARKKGELALLAAENALAERLGRIAQNSLPLLREDDPERLFTLLAEELPPADWERVTVNPADAGVARRLFPAAEIVADGAVTGGIVAVDSGGRLRVDNTLEKRLERGWPELLPSLMEELRREP
ncbi:MAG TPA: V-type ATP synthase subunit E [Geobacteraceae bacterium]